MLPSGGRQRAVGGAVKADAVNDQYRLRPTAIGGGTRRARQCSRGGGGGAAQRQRRLPSTWVVARRGRSARRAVRHRAARKRGSPRGKCTSLLDWIKTADGLAPSHPFQKVRQTVWGLSYIGSLLHLHVTRQLAHGVMHYTPHIRFSHLTRRHPPRRRPAQGRCGEVDAHRTRETVSFDSVSQRCPTVPQRTARWAQTPTKRETVGLR